MSLEATNGCAVFCVCRTDDFFFITNMTEIRNLFHIERMELLKLQKRNSVIGLS